MKINPFSAQKKKQFNLSDLTSDEFDAIIFAGATTVEHRGPSDAFTLEEMSQILGSEAFKSWPNRSKDWLWQTYAVESGLDDRK
jgi:hypothetical protein